MRFTLFAALGAFRFGIRPSIDLNNQGFNAVNNFKCDRAKHKGLEVGWPMIIPFVGWTSIKEPPKNAEDAAYVVPNEEAL